MHDKHVDLLHHPDTVRDITVIVARTVRTVDVAFLGLQDTHRAMDKARVVEHLVQSTVPQELESAPLQWAAIYSTSRTQGLLLAHGLARPRPKPTAQYLVEAYGRARMAIRSILA